MKIQRLLIPVFSLVLAFPSLLFPAPANKPAVKPKALFTSVRGTVEIKKSGAKAQPAKKDAIAAVGDRIAAGKDSSATLRFFDGSELRIKADTEVRIDRLTEGTKDKTLKFKLYLGKILANVKKLATPRSSFEIEAGGVVCGVRGTVYSMEYDPATKKLHLDVDEGVVFARSDSGTQDLKAGEDADFLGGKLQGDEKPGPGGPSAAKDTKDALEGTSIENSSLQSLNDMSNQLGTGALGNGDDSLTDPGVKGSVPVNVTVNVPIGEI